MTMETRMNWKQLLSAETQVPREIEPEEFAKYPMDDLEKDYKAIISSAAFRRLQDKTLPAIRSIGSLISSG